MSINLQPNSQDETTISSDTDEDLIVERIYKAVMEQRLAPNTKLSEARLCETFGVGRMRVRRALLLLSSQGIIDLQSNRGAYVACPDKAEANDVFAARMLIEPPLVRQLAQDPNEVSLALLTNHIALEDAARKDNARTEIIRLSGEFHTKLAKATGNKCISKTFVIVDKTYICTSMIVPIHLPIVGLDELYVIAAAVIGGTSFAGGIGTIYGAILGALVMQSLQTGMVLIGFDAAIQQIVVGTVLVVAVWIDSVYRRRAK